ncbi:aldo/keto reductase [Pseudoteredinibacter isoporae]|uniref:aldo/keto reductase n=1 Tax=Pseudoteredinibacter isoporae TaxID=570281 RepID=UPI0031094024
MSQTRLPQKPAPGLDFSISPLGLGTVKLGRNQGVKYPKAFELPSDQEAKTLLATARDCGINLIDTAPAYGHSEERLGQLLQGSRQDWVIVSKAGEEFDGGQSNFDFRPEHIRYSVERSLRRLKTDYIDMVLLHSDGNDMDAIAQGGLDALNELKQAGLIRASGMSTKTVEGGIAAAQQSDCVMLTYNLQETAEAKVLDYCAEHNKTALIKKALASGHIAHHDEKNGVLESMKFVFAHPGSTSAIIGTINPKHLVENVGNFLHTI